jgi:hypothetical protein
LDPRQLPRWVRKRDGRRVPFEADKISQGLFAATEARQAPDAFLARELADGVLHFLAQEAEGAEPSTEQIADLVMKVTRELGHPELAQTFQRVRAADAPTPRGKKEEDVLLLPLAPDDTVRKIARRARRLLQRRRVYTRDLVSAMDDGLLRGCLEDRADAVESLLVEPVETDRPWEQALLERIVALRPEVAKTFVIDGPDYRLAPESATAPRWLRDVARTLHALRRRAALHVGSSEPPVWAGRVGVGPLFQGTERENSAAERRLVALALLEEWKRKPLGWERISFDWHEATPTLQAAAPRSAQEAVLLDRVSTRTFDRPGQPIALSAGLDRGHAACLMSIGLDLHRFLNLRGIEGEAASLLDKLPRLVDMAVSAAVQKRKRLLAALPRHAFLAQGFLAHRARLHLRPIGVPRVMEQLLGRGTTVNEAGVELARLLARSLAGQAKVHGETRNMDVLVAIAFSLAPEASTQEVEKTLRLAEEFAAAGVCVTLRMPRAWVRKDVSLSLPPRIAQKTRIARIVFTGATV